MSLNLNVFYSCCISCPSPHNYYLKCFSSRTYRCFLALIFTTINQNLSKLFLFQFLLVLPFFRPRVFGHEQTRTHPSLQEKSRRLPAREKSRRKKGEKPNRQFSKRLEKNKFFTNQTIKLILFSLSIF